MTYHDPTGCGTTFLLVAVLVALGLAVMVLVR